MNGSLLLLWCWSFLTLSPPFKPDKLPELGHRGPPEEEWGAEGEAGEDGLDRVQWE